MYSLSYLDNERLKLIIKEGARSNGLLRIDDESFNQLVKVLNLPLEERGKKKRDLEDIKEALRKRSLSIDSSQSSEKWP